MIVFKKDSQVVAKKTVGAIAHYVCDKCEVEIPYSSIDAFSFKITNIEGAKVEGGGKIIVREIDLCKDCSARLIEKLKLDGYRFSIIEDDYLDWLIKKPTYNNKSNAHF